MAAIAGSLVASRAWERLGYARLRDYAVERVGLSARSIYDLAHLDSALRELPGVERALIGGSLSWTKVRLLARVAVREDETFWIERARCLSARALAHEVRQTDLASFDGPAPPAGDSGDASSVREGIQLRCTPDVAMKWRFTQVVARRVAGEKLTAWECLEAVSAEVLSALPLDTSAARHADPGTTNTTPLRFPAGSLRSRRRRRRGLDPGPELMVDQVTSSPFLRSLLRGLSSADAFELDRRLRRAIRLEQRLDAELGTRLLPLIEERSYAVRGCATLDAFVRERLGMSPRKVRALLRLERAARRCPELRAAYRTGRLSWLQALMLIPPVLAAPRSARSWIAWAQRVTVRRLEDDIGRALDLSSADPEAFSRTGGLPFSDDRQTGAQPTPPRRPPTRSDECARPLIFAPVEVVRLFRAVLCTVRRRLGHASEGQAFAAMLDHALEVWSTTGETPAARRRHRVFARDGWRCTVPGCSSYRNLHDHHVRFRSSGGSDALSNRTTLCIWHHLRGVHAGRVRVSGSAPRRLRFELGLRQGARPLVAYRYDEMLICRTFKPASRRRVNDTSPIG